MSFPLSDFQSYLVPFDFNAKIRVNVTRNGELIQRDIELVSVRIFAADKTETPDGLFSVRYSDTQMNKYSAEELVQGFLCFLKNIEIPHNSDGYVCYCKKCNDDRAREQNILSVAPEDCPF